MTTDQAAAFFGRINEMQPVHGLDGAIQDLLGGAFALLALIVLAARYRTQAATLLYAAACTALLLAAAATHIRFATYPALAGAVLLPVALTAISASAAPALLQSLGRLACLATLVGAPALAPLAATAKPIHVAHTCDLQGAVAMLDNHPGAIVLADVNDGPALLYHTAILIVGSLYHRNIEGFMRLRAAWRSSPAATGPTPELRATGATLVLACPQAARSMLVDDLGQDTLAARLNSDAPPPWLHRLASAGPGGYVLYEVTP